MTRIKRPAAAVGAAVLLAFSLSACGGAPDDASKDDFCEVANSIPSDPDVDAIHDWAEDAEDTGTPEDIPDDARDGFELLVDIANDVDEDDLDNEEFLDDLSSDEEDQFAAYGAYVAETCGNLDIPSDLPTDLTDLPTDLTDLPTDLSDLPTDLSDLTELPTTTE